MEQKVDQLRGAPEKVPLGVHLESPNLSPRALIGTFSVVTGRIGLVLTGPNTVP
jgi:hypothetical protein